MNQFKQIFIGSDHNGFNLKNDLRAYLAKRGYQITDVGDVVLDPNDDFPEFAAKAAAAVLTHDEAAAILICGGGQGMCMAANRFKGIRASLLWDEHEAQMTRNDNDANVACLPGRVLEQKPEQCQLIIEAFLNTPFAGATRFKRRNQQLDYLN